MAKLDKSLNWKPKDVSPKEAEKWRSFAKEVLQAVNYKGDINVKAGQIIREAKKGWDRAPSEFGERVKFKIGHRRLNFYEAGKEEDYSHLTHDSPGRTPRTKSERYQKETLDHIKDIDPLELLSPSFLSSEELQFVEKRKKIYNKEFEFNESSDQILLQQILVDELIIRRISLARFQGEDVSQSSIDKTMDRFRKNLEKLGVLRVQRIELNSDIQGNVGQLSIELDKKLDRIKKIKDQELRKEIVDKHIEKLAYSTPEEIVQMAEEIELQRTHELKFPANEVPLEEIHIE